MNGPNGFFWLLIALPVYLLANGKFVNYVRLLGTSDGVVAAPGAKPTGLNNNQAVV